jgi:hypothetical protein
MNVSRVIAIVIGVQLFGTGCTPRPEVELFSNAKSTLTVLTGDAEPCELAPKGLCRFPLKYRLQVRRNGVEYEYRMPADLSTETSSDWIEFRAVSRRIIKLQIEDDGTIYILNPRSSGVTATHGPQRHGFPLGPQPGAEKVDQRG